MERLRQLRLEKKATQQEVAAAVAVDRTTYVKWETGKNSPPINSLEALAEYFNTSTDYLLGRSVNKEKTPPAEAEDVTFDDFSYAMYEEGQFLTEEQKTALLNMARQLSQALKKDEKKKD